MIRLGGIEAGGTKMVCAVTDEEGNVLDRAVIPTEDAETTIAAMVQYYREHPVDALGIACFGPLDLNRESETYGMITRTPKAGWEDINIIKPFSEALNIPVGLDTDVNGAILGEVMFGAAKGCNSAIYVTIGTGIGAGVYVNGALLHGLVHPESGHILMARHPDDPYEGCCPYHRSCFEGLASGTSIAKRWKRPGKELYDRKEVWELEAYYIAQALTNYILSYSPQKIVLWGGVMHNEALFPMIREKVKENLNGYIVSDVIENHMDEYIVAPGLGENPGILGAAYLGFLELQK